MDSIGGKLKQLRTSRSLTLKSLSNASGLSVSYISDIENERKKPSIETLRKILEVYNLTMNDFFDENDSNIFVDSKKKELTLNWESEMKNIISRVKTTANMTQEEFIIKIVEMINEGYETSKVSFDGKNISFLDDALKDKEITLGEIFFLLQKMLDKK